MWRYVSGEEVNRRAHEAALGFFARKRRRNVGECDQGVCRRVVFLLCEFNSLLSAFALSLLYFPITFIHMVGMP